MNLHFQFRRYRLPFRAPVRTAHGFWPAREGVIVRLEQVGRDGASAASERDQPGGGPGVGYGEAAPIPEFGTETVDEVEAACRGLGEWITPAALEALPARLGCLRHAITAGWSQLTAPSMPVPAADARRTIAVAALLPAGRAALPLIPERAEAGFRVFKWKVGVADLADELSLLDDVCAALPSGGKLRLDANGAWDRRQAERWLERCADRPVEFVEQPAFAPASEGGSRQKKIEDLLRGLAESFPTPIALDESLIGERDIQYWCESGWRGIFVLKPALVADLGAALARLEKARAHVVFSSALETAVGAGTALRAAFGWRGESRALGFGVWPLFADRRFDGPHIAPYIRLEDVQAMSAESVWAALA